SAASPGRRGRPGAPSSMCSQVREFPSGSDTPEGRRSGPAAANLQRARAGDLGYLRDADAGRGLARPAEGPTPMKHPITALLAAGALVLASLRANAEEPPKAAPPAAAQAGSTATSSASPAVSTSATVVVATHVDTGHWLP